jgi:hypothetical protein
VKIKKAYEIPDVSEQKESHKNMERVQEGDTTKEMRITTKEMTERRTKMKMKSTVAKTRTGKLYDPGQTKF